MTVRKAAHHISCSDYALYMLRTTEQNSKYLSYDSQRGFALFPEKELAAKAGSTPLNLREITYLGYGLKGELLENGDSASISQVLRRMGLRRQLKERRQQLLLRLIARIWDALRNGIDGHGLHTTAWLALKLSEELAKHSPFQPTPPPGKPLQPRHQLIANKITPGTSRALDAYKKGPQSCLKMHKIQLFGAIHKIRPNHRYDQDIGVLENLICYLTQSNQIDLFHELTKDVICKAFGFGTNELSVRLAEWLSLQPTYNTDLLSHCLNTLENNRMHHKPVDWYALHHLLKSYLDKGWNIQGDGKNPPLAINTPCIVTSTALLCDLAPNDDLVIALVKRMLEQPEFDPNTFKAWTAIFKGRAEGTRAPNLYYPLRDLLQAYLEKHPEWKRDSP